MGFKLVRKRGPAAETIKLGLKELGGTVSKVGWFETAKYANGTPVAAVAAIQEFGAPSKNIPPRSFMRTTSVDKQATWAATAGKGAKAVLNGNASAETVMNALGAQASGDIAKKIATISNPPLKQSTIDNRRRRMSDRKTVGNLTKPLVDTGIMIGSITWVVEGKTK